MYSWRKGRYMITARGRILSIRLAEKIRRQPEFARSIGVSMVEPAKRNKSDSGRSGKVVSDYSQRR